MTLRNHIHPSIQRNPTGLPQDPNWGDGKVEMAIYNLKASLVKIVVLLVAVNLINPPLAQAAGRCTTTVANTIRSGSGVPAASLGIDGDFILILKP